MHPSFFLKRQSIQLSLLSPVLLLLPLHSQATWRKPGSVRLLSPSLTSFHHGFMVPLSQVGDLVLHSGSNLLESVAQLHLLGCGVLLQRCDDLVIVLVDVLVQLMQGDKVIQLS